MIKVICLPKTTLDFLSDTLAQIKFYKGRIQSTETLLQYVVSLQKVTTYSTSICSDTVADFFHHT